MSFVLTHNLLEYCPGFFSYHNVAAKLFLFAVLLRPVALLQIIVGFKWFFPKGSLVFSFFLTFILISKSSSDVY